MRKNTASFVKTPQQQSNSTPFSHFLEEYPLYTFWVGNMCWRYRSCGKGSETLLLLPGAPGLSCTCFPDIQFFEQDFRLIVPDYPVQAETIATLVEGLDLLLAALNIEQVCLVGGSYGGLVAQAFIQRYPQKVGKLVLSHSTVPRKWRGIFFRMLITLIEILPARLVSLLTQATLPLYMHTFPGPQDLWYACFSQVLKTLQKSDYLARLRVHVDFDRKDNITERPCWSGPTLLIASDDDPYTNRREQSTLQHLYPQAISHTFQHTSHYAWATDSLSYFSLIKTFLSS